MQTREFRDYQRDADNAISNELLVANKCIVKMFCGTGKSLLMRHCSVIQNLPLVVFVFPSLALIEQFYADYLDDFVGEARCVLKVSSDVGATTDIPIITQFLQTTILTNKIVCITYQSFDVFVLCLLDTNTFVDVCIFDEAHHAVGETYQKLIFENDVCHKQIFFTATPKNANGIVMYDRDSRDVGTCGRLVYDYSYLRGIDEGYLNPFEIRIDLFTDNNVRSIMESIARAVLASGNGRVLTFHLDVNTDREKSVNNFANEAEFKRVFRQIHAAEFPEVKRSKYAKIHMKSLSSNTKPSARKDILSQFDETPDNAVFVISSCETIGEGIDTKNANMCVFVDPKRSSVKIIQNIGRIVRKQFGIDKPNSTILIPCWVDKAKYIDCQDDKSKCDAVIRQEMISADGNFNGILNVMSALKQEDEDLYDICMHYPDSFAPHEVFANLAKHGYSVGDQIGDGGAEETMEYLLDVSVSDAAYDNGDDNDDDDGDIDIDSRMIAMAEKHNVCVEIHTTYLETPVEWMNVDACQNNGDVVRMYRETDAETGEDIYFPVSLPLNLCTKPGVSAKQRTPGTGTKQRIDGAKRASRLRANVHTNPDVQVLWKIVGNIYSDVCSCIIDCEVIETRGVERWKAKLEEMKGYMDINEKRPSRSDKNSIFKQLGGWVDHQLTNYDPIIELCKQAMKTVEIHALWTETLHDARYRKYLVIDNESVWKAKLEEMKGYMDANNKRPSDHDKNSITKQLGRWVCTQSANYDPNIALCKHVMKTVDIHALWTETINDAQIGRAHV